jgi:hypothetical protein
MLLCCSVLPIAAPAAETDSVDRLNQLLSRFPQVNLRLLVDALDFTANRMRRVFGMSRAGPAKAMNR